MIKAIVFDLYGVLGLNGWQSFKVKHFSDRPEDWQELRALGQKVDAGVVGDDVFVEAIARVTGETDATVRYQFEHTQPNLKLLAFIKNELKPYKIGLLSNAGHNVVSGIFTPSQQELFDAVVLSAFIGFTKPDPRTFHSICLQLDVDFNEAIMVDDQIGHLEQARCLGMHTVLYESAQQTMQDIRKALGV